MKSKISLAILALLAMSGTAYARQCSGHKKPEATVIAIIDTGLDLSDPRFKKHLCPTGHKNFVEEETIDDINGHGNHVAGLIQKYAGKANYCMLIYKYYTDSAPGKVNERRYISALKEAIKNKADIVNFSGEGYEFDEEEALLISSHPSITIVAASGNEGVDIDLPKNHIYPAYLGYKNIESVGSVNKDGIRSKFSNYGKEVKNFEMGENVLSYFPENKMGYMSGTSQATAIFSGKLVAKKSKSCQ